MAGHGVTRERILEARERIRPYAVRTPVMTSSSIDALTGTRLFFKCENLQRVGAFKFRGACNAVFSLTDVEASRGVATHSSGNHAQALALAARLRGVKATVVMPANAPAVKRRAVEGYGAGIVGCEPTLEAREAALAEVVRETGAVFVHPYDDERVIAGQATAAAELFEEAPNIDMIVVPVGGGGLLSGTCLSARYFAPTVEAWGAEPAGADDAFRSLREGRRIPQTDPRTVADGLRTSLSDRTFSIIRDNAKGIATASERSIAVAMRLIFERMKIVVEPSGAVPLASVLDGNLPAKGKRVGVILSGGNVSPESFAQTTAGAVNP